MVVLFFWKVLYSVWAPRGWNGGAPEGTGRRLAPELETEPVPETKRPLGGSPRSGRRQVRSLGAVSISFASSADPRTSRKCEMASLVLPWSNSEIPSGQDLFHGRFWHVAYSPGGSILKVGPERLERWRRVGNTEGRLQVLKQSLCLKQQRPSEGSPGRPEAKYNHSRPSCFRRLLRDVDVEPCPERLSLEIAR